MKSEKAKVRGSRESSIDGMLEDEAVLDFKVIDEVVGDAEAGELDLTDKVVIGDVSVLEREREVIDAVVGVEAVLEWEVIDGVVEGAKYKGRDSDKVIAS